jgi:hypothetical protein
MGDKMRNYIIRPMPPSDFLKEFFPKKSIWGTNKAKTYKSGCFSQVVSCSSEIQAYAPFIHSFIMITP